jgi:hypothetical protein
MEHRRLKRALVGLSLLSVGATASAESLATLWALKPTSADLPTTAVYGKQFLEQRLLPVKLARLVENAAESAAKGTLLYVVFTPDGRVGYCTFKNISLKNQASTLFMPVLDKRPCFVDRDNDGKFDAVFSVFDKFGSMATPSGNMGEARSLSAPIPYEQVNPHLAPQGMRIAFELGGSKQPERARVSVKFDKAGRNRWEYLVGPTPRDGSTLAVLNAQVTVRSVVGKQATIAVSLDPDVFVTGSSGGTLSTTPRPPFLE